VRGSSQKATWLLAFGAGAGVEGILRYGPGRAGVTGVSAGAEPWHHPTHRGLGLGTLLLHRALSGFRSAGLRRVYLEVTSQNSGAIRLYQRLGFRRVKTVYKAADVAYA